MTLVVVGDALLDVDLLGVSRRLCPDAPAPVVEDVEERERPGGAGLAALLAAGSGHEVVLIAPLADDDGGRRLQAMLSSRLRVIPVPYEGSTPVKQRVRVDGRSLVRIDRGGTDGRVGALPADAVAALRGAGAVLVSDYGRGASASADLRDLLSALAPSRPVIWDPHPRGSTPVSGVRLATPNADEAARLVPLDSAAPSSPVAAVAARAAELVRRWGAGAVAVTLGARGALLSLGAATPMVIPPPQVHTGDPCGAGDRFAATAAIALLSGALPSEAVRAAVAEAAGFVGAGGASAIDLSRPAPEPLATSAGLVPEPRSAEAVIAATRARGGVVVATGGCFDLLHAGHISTLQAARELGDCLVVCLNSDASVRRLKGPARPLVPQADRARVLAALSCVDAVATFDEDTPEQLLARLRPDVWAKGGDYADVSLPEADLVVSWGGKAVVLPYLDGRSTTGLVRAAVLDRDFS